MGAVIGQRGLLADRVVCAVLVGRSGEANGAVRLLVQASGSIIEAAELFSAPFFG